MATRAVELEGMLETLKAVREISSALERQETNAQLRQAAGQCAAGLVGDLQQSAAASGVPVAPKVAATIRVRSDRLPVVSIGSAKTAGILWGSEHGPKSDPNRFGVAPNSSGYWITPAVARFTAGQATEIYKRAVLDVFKEHGLV